MNPDHLTNFLYLLALIIQGAQHQAKDLNISQTNEVRKRWKLRLRKLVDM